MRDPSEAQDRPRFQLLRREKLRREKECAPFWVGKLSADYVTRNNEWLSCGRWRHGAVQSSEHFFFLKATILLGSLGQSSLTAFQNLPTFFSGVELHGVDCHKQSSSRAMTDRSPVFYMAALST